MMRMLPVIKDRKINLAMVGYGRVAKNHIDAILKHNKDLNLVAICDVNESIIKDVCQETGAKLYTELDVMLADPEIDAVTFCTPSGLHAEQTIQAANAGKHVICEKPMATRWEDGLAMIEACDANGVRLFIVKQNRFNDTMQRLKQAITEGRFGKMYMVALNVFWQRAQAYYDMAKWRGTWEFDGGALMNQASHYVDLLRWLVGPIESVQAMMGTLARSIEVEDTAVLNIRWRNGALGSVNVTNLVYPKDFEGSVTLLGEKGTVRLGGIALNKIEHWEFADQRPEDKDVMSANYETDSVYGFGHVPYYQNVIDVFRGVAEPETDGREGLKTLEVLIASYLAARDDTTIALPLVY
jgi:UDP-N-acetyl-2-amino-2-deoxyglucuronate dehydrogenase